MGATQKQQQLHKKHATNTCCGGVYGGKRGARVQETMLSGDVVGELEWWGYGWDGMWAHEAVNWWWVVGGEW